MKRLLIAAIMFLSMPSFAAVNLSPHIDLGISGISVPVGVAGGLSIGVTMLESGNWKYARIGAATTIKSVWIELQPIGYGNDDLAVWIGAGMLTHSGYIDQYGVDDRWGVAVTVAVRLK